MPRRPHNDGADGDDDAAKGTAAAPARPLLHGPVRRTSGARLVSPQETGENAAHDAGQANTEEDTEGTTDASGVEGSSGGVRAGPGRENEEDAALRPRTFDEFVGQKKILENLTVYVQAAKKRGDALDHVLLAGPPGLGKTTLAFLLAREMGTDIRVTSGPALERKGDLAGILTSLGRGDILFIDEIHRLQPVVEESLYPAMEDFRIEIVTGAGAGARAIPLALERFTLVGATTRSGQLTSPMLSRFGIVEQFGFYSPAELTTVVKRSARLLNIAMEEGGAEEIGRRARGTPRIANRLLRRVRDFAEVRGDGRITHDLAAYALSRLEVDAAGLDAQDRRFLRMMIERFAGGPVGIESLAASLAEDRDTLEAVYEPYLIQEGYVVRTPRGRVATRRAYEHMNVPPPPTPGQGALF